MPPDHRAPAAASPPLSLNIDPAALKPLIAAVVAETVQALEQDRAALGDRLAWSEPEAARLLGLHAHQLRDERLRGKIGATQIVGRRVRYTRDDLLAYLAAGRANGGEG